MGLAAVAPWIALASAVLACVIVAVAGHRTWRSWRRTHVTQQAANALVEVHRTRLEATLARIDDRTGRVADGGEELAEAVAELRADTAHLQWMLQRVPRERARLHRALADLVLPTTSTRDDDRDASDDDA